MASSAAAREEFKRKLASGALAIPFGASAAASREKLESKPGAPIEHKVTTRVTAKSGRKKPKKRGFTNYVDASVTAGSANGLMAAIERNDAAAAAPAIDTGYNSRMSVAAPSHHLAYQPPPSVPPVTPQHRYHDTITQVPSTVTAASPRSSAVPAPATVVFDETPPPPPAASADGGPGASADASGGRRLSEFSSHNAKLDTMENRLIGSSGTPVTTTTAAAAAPTTRPSAMSSAIQAFDPEALRQAMAAQKLEEEAEARKQAAASAADAAREADAAAQAAAAKQEALATAARAEAARKAQIDADAAAAALAAATAGVAADVFNISEVTTRPASQSIQITEIPVVTASAGGPAPVVVETAPAAATPATAFGADVNAAPAAAAVTTDGKAAGGDDVPANKPTVVITDFPAIDIMAAVARLQNGEILTRYPAGGGSTLPRRVFVAQDTYGNDTLGWCQPDKHELVKGLMIALDDISFVFVGKTSKTFDTEAGLKAKEDHSFSIVSPKRSLDLEASNTQQRDDFMYALLAVLNYRKSRYQARRDASLPAPVFITPGQPAAQATAAAAAAVEEVPPPPPPTTAEAGPDAAAALVAAQAAQAAAQAAAAAAAAAAEAEKQKAAADAEAAARVEMERANKAKADAAAAAAAQAEKDAAALVASSAAAAAQARAQAEAAEAQAKAAAAAEAEAKAAAAAAAAAAAGPAKVEANKLPPGFKRAPSIAVDGAFCPLLHVSIQSVSGAPIRRPNPSLVVVSRFVSKDSDSSREGPVASGSTSKFTSISPAATTVAADGTIIINHSFMHEFDAPQSADVAVAMDVFDKDPAGDVSLGRALVRLDGAAFSEGKAIDGSLPLVARPGEAHPMSGELKVAITYQSSAWLTAAVNVQRAGARGIWENGAQFTMYTANPPAKSDKFVFFKKGQEKDRIYWCVPPKKKLAECKFLNITKLVRVVVGKDHRVFGSASASAPNEMCFSFEEAAGKSIVALEASSREMRDSFVQTLCIMLDSYNTKYSIVNIGENGVEIKDTAPATETGDVVSPLGAGVTRPSVADGGNGTLLRIDNKMNDLKEKARQQTAAAEQALAADPNGTLPFRNASASIASSTMSSPNASMAMNPATALMIALSANSNGASMSGPSVSGASFAGGAVPGASVSAAPGASVALSGASVSVAAQNQMQIEKEAAVAAERERAIAEAAAAKKKLEDDAARAQLAAAQAQANAAQAQATAAAAVSAAQAADSAASAPIVRGQDGKEWEKITNPSTRRSFYRRVDDKNVITLEDPVAAAEKAAAIRATALAAANAGSPVPPSALAEPPLQKPMPSDRLVNPWVLYIPASGSASSKFWIRLDNAYKTDTRPAEWIDTYEVSPLTLKAWKDKWDAQENEKKLAAQQARDEAERKAVAAANEAAEAAKQAKQANAAAAAAVAAAAAAASGPAPPAFVEAGPGGAARSNGQSSALPPAELSTAAARAAAAEAAAMSSAPAPKEIGTRTRFIPAADVQQRGELVEKPATVADPCQLTVEAVGLPELVHLYNMLYVGVYVRKNGVQKLLGKLKVRASDAKGALTPFEGLIALDDASNGHFNDRVILQLYAIGTPGSLDGSLGAEKMLFIGAGEAPFNNALEGSYDFDLLNPEDPKLEKQLQDKAKLILKSKRPNDTAGSQFARKERRNTAIRLAPDKSKAALAGKGAAAASAAAAAQAAADSAPGEDDDLFKFVEQIEQMMFTGGLFNKYGDAMEPIYIRFKPSVCALVWDDAKSVVKKGARNDEASRSFPLQLVQHIYLGKQRDRLKLQPNAVEGNCFSLVAQHATLDLEATSPRDRAAWVFGIRTILRKKGIFVKEHQIPEDDSATTKANDGDAAEDAFTKPYYVNEDVNSVDEKLQTGESVDPNLSLDDVWEQNPSAYQKAIAVNVVDIEKAMEKLDKRDANAPDVKLLNSKLVPANWDTNPKPKPVTVEVPEQRACQTGDCTIM